MVFPKWKDYIKSSPLVVNPDKMVNDGWGNEFKVTVEQSADGNNLIVVRSDRLDAYEKTKWYRKSSGPT